jgi:hypothetical protein
MMNKYLEKTKGLADPLHDRVINLQVKIIGDPHVRIFFYQSRSFFIF